MFGIKGVHLIVEGEAVAAMPWGVAQYGPLAFDGPRWSLATRPKPVRGPYFHDGGVVSLHVTGDVDEPRNAQTQLRFTGFAAVQVRVGYKVSRWQVTMRLTDLGVVAAHPGFTIQDQGPDGWDLPASAVLPLYEAEDIGSSLANACFALSQEWKEFVPGYAGAFRGKALQAIDEYLGRQPYLMTGTDKRVRPTSVLLETWRDGPVIRAGEVLWIG